jgi:hypothetical protein
MTTKARTQELPAEIDEAGARAALQAAAKQREEACREEFEAVIGPILQKYNCGLFPVIHLAGGQVQTGIEIRSL